MDQPDAAPPEDDDEELIPAGPYRYVALGAPLLGRGGMGLVERVEDRALGRQVAKKQLSAARAGDPISRRRFLREARITAALEHPGIVPMYDLGEDVEGDLYYTMRLVPGRTLADALAATSAYAERLPLVSSVISASHAVGFAHARRVLHRDLKPANVMVGPYGETVVVDWGAARDTHPAEGDDPLVTQAGHLVGTPAYMSPEQVRGPTAAGPDPRMDVYALGAVLYEVLTGKRAHPGRTASETLTHVLRGEVLPVRAAEPAVPAPLAAIVERALAVRPEDRYPDAEALAQDLERWQRGEAVEAHRYSVAERIERQLRQHRLAVQVGLVAAGLLLLGGLVAVVRVLQARDEAVTALAASVQAEGRAQASATAAARRLSDSLVVRATRQRDDGDRQGAFALAAAALQEVETPAARGLVLGLWEGWTPRLARTIPTGGCARVRWSSDGRWIACMTPDRVGVWSAAGEPVRIVPWDHLTDVAFGTSVLYLTSEAGDVVRVGLPDGDVRFVRSGAAAPTAVAWTAQGIAVGSRTAEVTLLDPLTLAVRRSFRVPDHVNGLGVDPTGLRLAVASAEIAARVRVDGRVEWASAPGRDGVVGADVDGAGRLAWGGGDRAVRMWGPAGPAGPVIVGRHAGLINEVAWSPRGALLATGAEDGTVRLWDVDRRAEITRLIGLGGWSGAFAFSPDGRELITGGRHTDARVWSLPEAPAPGWATQAQVGSVSWVGDSIVASTGDSVLEARGLDGQVRFRADLAHEKLLGSLSLGSRVWASLANPPELRAFDGSTGAVLARHPLEGGATALLQTQGDALIASAPDRVYIVDASGFRSYPWDARGAVGVVLDPPGPVRTGWAILDDGRMVDLDGRRAERRLPGHPFRVTTDGVRLVVGDRDGTVRVLSLPDLAPLLTLAGHPVDVSALALQGSGGRLLASGDLDGNLRLWDLPTGRERARMDPADGGIDGLAWSEDGRHLAAGTWGRAVRVWATEPLELPAEALAAHVRSAFGLRVDGAEVVSTSGR